MNVQCHVTNAYSYYFELRQAVVEEKIFKVSNKVIKCKSARPSVGHVFSQTNMVKEI